MIIKRKVLKLGGTRYVGLPNDFRVKKGEEVVVIHNQIVGFIIPCAIQFPDEEFKAELKAVARMLTDAREVLKAEAKTEVVAAT